MSICMKPTESECSPKTIKTWAGAQDMERNLLYFCALLQPHVTREKQSHATNIKRSQVLDTEGKHFDNLLMKPISK